MLPVAGGEVESVSRRLGSLLQRNPDAKRSGPPDLAPLVL